MNIFEQNARTAAIGYRAGEISLDTLSRSVLPLIYKIAAAAAYKLRMDVADDLAMSVWIRFQTKGINQWDEDKSIGAYLSSITRNEARAVWNDQNQYAAPMLNDEGEVINTTEEVIESASFNSQYNLVDVVGRNIAIGAIKQKLQYTDKRKAIGGESITEESDMSKVKTMGGITAMPPLEKMPPPRVTVKKTEAKKTYQLNADQEELTRIYHQLRDDNGLTQSTFAEKLHIGSARLASYLYGRTSGVPENIMDAARALLKSPDHIKNKFGSKSMVSILREWAKKLGVKEGDDVKIAALIGINVSTVCRWRTGETKPSNVELIRYDTMVDVTAERIKKSTKMIDSMA